MSGSSSWSNSQFELPHWAIGWSTLFDFSSEVGPSIAGCPGFEGAESTSTAARHWERQHLLLLLGCRWWNIQIFFSYALFLFHCQLGLIFVTLHLVTGIFERVLVCQYAHTNTNTQWLAQECHNVSHIISGLNHFELELMGTACSSNTMQDGGVSHYKYYIDISISLWVAVRNSNSAHIDGMERWTFAKTNKQ